MNESSTNAGSPRVGIIYFVDAILHIESSPVTAGGAYGRFVIHDADHFQYWAQLVAAGRVSDAEYDEHPRGRVAYDTRSKEFSLLADKCILKDTSLVSKVLSSLNLAKEQVRVQPDLHYRCFKCLRQEDEA